MLNLFDEYSLVWLNMGTLVLIPFFITLIHLRFSIQSGISSAQFESERFCDQINHAATQAAALPHLMLQDSIKAKHAIIDSLARQLVFMTQALEEIIIWIIGAYKSMYRCLLGLAINGAISAVTKIAGPVQQAAEKILSGLEKGSSVIGHLLAGDSNEQVSDNGIQLGNWTSTMQNVQSTVQNWTMNNGTDDPFNNLIRQPFEAIKQHIHDNVASWKPDNVSIASFSSTSDMQDSLYCDPTFVKDSLNNLQGKLILITSIMIGILAFVLIITIVLNFLWIRFQYTYVGKQIRELSFIFATSQQLDKSGESLIRERREIEKELEKLGHANKYPILGYLSDKYTKFYEFEQNRPILTWWLHYLTHPLILYCFIVGFFGLILTFTASASIHHVLNKDVDNQAASMERWAIDQSNHATLQSLSFIESQTNTLNQWIIKSETDINERTFGSIRSAALSTNQTIGVVTDHISQFVSNVFGGTVFEGTINDVLDCLFMTKIEQLENGLTWISQNTYVNLTRVNVLDVKSSVEKNIQNSLGVSDFLSVVQKKMDTKLYQQLIFYSIILSLWGLCILIALFLQLQKCIRIMISKE